MRPSRVFPGLPPHYPGQRIGLFGGSFNPAHAGHRQVSLLALRRLALHQVWWLVTPGNPLKDAGGLTPLETRMRGAAAIAASPSIVVSGAEAAFRTRFTVDFLRILMARAPAVRFVWIMGSDNLAQLHRWDRWRDIANMTPIAVVNRPGRLTAPLSARAAQVLARFRMDEADAGGLADRLPPAWTFLIGPRSPMSSTALRKRGGQPTS